MYGAAKDGACAMRGMMGCDVIPPSIRILEMRIQGLLIASETSSNGMAHDDYGTCGPGSTAVMIRRASTRMGHGQPQGCRGLSGAEQY